MRKSLPLLAIFLALAGCNAQDMQTIGQIARKVHVHVADTLGDQPDNMMKSLPLLPPEGAGIKTAAPVNSVRPAN